MVFGPEPGLWTTFRVHGISQPTVREVRGWTFHWCRQGHVHRNSLIRSERVWAPDFLAPIVAIPATSIHNPASRERRGARFAAQAAHGALEGAHTGVDIPAIHELNITISAALALG